MAPAPGLISTITCVTQRLPGLKSSSWENTLNCMDERARRRELEKSKIMSRGIKGHSPRGGARKVPGFSELLPFNSQGLRLAAIFLPPSLCLPTPPQTYKLPDKFPFCPTHIGLLGLNKAALMIFSQLRENTHQETQSTASIIVARVGKRPPSNVCGGKRPPRLLFAQSGSEGLGVGRTRCPGV